MIQAYCILRDNRTDIPFATLLNTMNNNSTNKYTLERKDWVKKAHFNGIKLFQIDGSTDRKLCNFIKDEHLFEVCPICLDLLNTDKVAHCWNSLI